MFEKMISSILKNSMAVIFRGVNGLDWGFYTNEEERMHIQVVSEEENFKIFLEENGERTFLPLGRIPSKYLQPIKEKVIEKRDVIEKKWVNLMIQKGWIDFSINEKTSECILTIYPNKNFSFKRIIFLNKEAKLESYSKRNVKLDEKTSSLVLDNDYHVFLPNIIWKN